MSLKVLLIDDHMLFREGLISLLQRRNIEVLAAVGDGNEGIKLAQEFFCFWIRDRFSYTIDLPKVFGAYASLEHEIKKESS